VHDIVLELLVSKVARAKLGARNISESEAEQLLRNDHITSRNAGAGGRARRRLLIGRTDGGRMLTLVIEQAFDHGTWLVVTGWTATASERRMLS
jgi:hypothetical protein